jgi:hypothetical protein
MVMGLPIDDVKLRTIECKSLAVSLHSLSDESLLCPGRRDVLLYIHITNHSSKRYKKIV